MQGTSCGIHFFLFVTQREANNYVKLPRSLFEKPCLETGLAQVATAGGSNKKLQLRHTVSDSPTIAEKVIGTLVYS